MSFDRHQRLPATGGGSVRAPRRTRLRPRALVLAAMSAVLWLVAPAPAASAHATLLASTPPAGYAVVTSPSALTLDFDEPVTIATAPVDLADSAGHQQRLGPAVLSLHGRRLTVPVAQRLAPGGYREHWQVTADDGDLVAGTITFTVGTGTVAAAPSGGSPIDSPVVIVLRWLLFTGLALALGGVVGGVLAGRIAGEAHAEGTELGVPRPWVLAGAVLGLLAAVGLVLDQVGGGLSTVTAGGAGRILLVEVLGFAVAAAFAVCHRRRRGAAWGVAVVVALLAVVIAEGWRAHPHANAGVLGTVLTVVHLLCAAVWVGALVQVLWTVRGWRGEGGWSRVLVYGYSRLAFILVLVVVGTGTAEAVIVLPTLSALYESTYGRLLLVKLGLVTIALALAVLARRRLQRSIARPSLPPGGRVVRAEATAVAVVLAMTAVLVSAAPPGPATAALAAPPPPVGLIVPAATLAGQITVIATASTGRLVVRLGVPGADALGSDDGDTSSSPPPSYTVDARLSRPGQTARAVSLQGCGPGCFTSPVDWGSGTNQLHLGIAASPWHGGVADFDIPWPPRAASTVMPQVLAAMRSAGAMTVHEAVSSDYSGDAGTEEVLTLSGADYVARQSYVSGGGNPVVLGVANGETTVALAFPQGIVIRLVLGPDHRILHEVTVSPNHLITTDFDYTP